MAGNFRLPPSIATGFSRRLWPTPPATSCRVSSPQETASSPFSRAIQVPAAAKTGTSDGGYYAAFGGYTPRLAGYVSVFNPLHPTTTGAMVYGNACYREVSGAQECPSQMFGDFAPGATWQMTFLHISLPNVSFVPVPPSSPFYALGTGVNSPKPPAPPKKNTGPGGKPGPGPITPPGPGKGGGPGHH